MLGQRLSGIGDKLRPLLDGSRFSQPSGKSDQLNKSGTTATSSQIQKARGSAMPSQHAHIAAP